MPAGARLAPKPVISESSDQEKTRGALGGGKFVLPPLMKSGMCRRFWMTEGELVRSALMNMKLGRILDVLIYRVPVSNPVSNKVSET